MSCPSSYSFVGGMSVEDIGLWYITEGMNGDDVVEDDLILETKDYKNQ